MRSNQKVEKNKPALKLNFLSKTNWAGLDFEVENHDEPYWGGIPKTCFKVEILCKNMCLPLFYLFPIKPLIIIVEIYTPDFRMRDSAKVEKILVAAGKASYSESMYEAGPQSVTQVLHSILTINLENMFYPGVYSPEHRKDQQCSDILPGHICAFPFLGSIPGLFDHENP